MSISSALEYITSSPTTIYLALSASLIVGSAYLINEIVKVELNREYDEQEEIELKDRQFKIASRKEEVVEAVFYQTIKELWESAKNNKAIMLKQLCKRSKKAEEKKEWIQHHFRMDGVNSYIGH